MVMPKFPGQPPGQSGLDRLRQQQDRMRQDQERRRQMGASWEASQRRVDERMPGDRFEAPRRPADRLGLFGRFVRFVLSVTFFVAAGLAAVVAVGAYGEEDLETALIAGAAALIGLLLMLRVRRWGRS
jgi:hypothetical protein